eukprot:62119-Pleurochrysis_carterae.AAC.2
MHAHASVRSIVRGCRRTHERRRTRVYNCPCTQVPAHDEHASCGTQLAARINACAPSQSVSENTEARIGASEEAHARERAHTREWVRAHCGARLTHAGSAKGTRAHVHPRALACTHSRGTRHAADLQRP